jgi:hypothetical protein
LLVEVDLLLGQVVEEGLVRLLLQLRYVLLQEVLYLGERGHLSCALLVLIW